MREGGRLTVRLRGLCWSVVVMAAACGEPATPTEPPIHLRIDLPSLAACGPCHAPAMETGHPENMG